VGWGACVGVSYSPVVVGVFVTSTNGLWRPVLSRGGGRVTYRATLGIFCCVDVIGGWSENGGGCGEGNRRSEERSILVSVSCILLYESSSSIEFS